MAYWDNIRSAQMKFVATLLLILAAILAVIVLMGCAQTHYNIVFHDGAFRVADELTVEPGQGGDDGSSTASGSTAGGTESSPGGSNLLRGFAQQGNIFQIGTSAKPTTTTEARAAATVQSPNSTTATGEDTAATTGPTGPMPEPDTP